MNYYIITGSSRGIGNAIAKQLIKVNNYLVCISRTEDEEIKKLAVANNCKYHFIPFDLYEVDKIDNLIDEIFQHTRLFKKDRLFLINNAGVISPIAPLEKADAQEIKKAVNINYLAPMLLSGGVIMRAKDFSGSKRIINISSGAGLNPYHGWSTYCTTKAALTMLTRCIALEQGNEKNPVEVISITPGIVETNMQEIIRATNSQDFTNVDFFIKNKEENKNKTPEYAAEKIISLMHSSELKSGEFYDFIEL
jgi:benzil reductase ((S)-benzoin forming)